MSTQKRADELVNAMYEFTSKAYKRAVANAQVGMLGHAEMSDAHLLLGILAAGNADNTVPVPRIFREAGANYGTLYAFLDKHTELRTGASESTPPKPSKTLVRTLVRAYRLAKRRHAKHNEEQVTIIMVDIARALLKSKDPLLVQALCEMGVDTAVLRKRFFDGSEHALATNTSNLKLVS